MQCPFWGVGWQWRVRAGPWAGPGGGGYEWDQPAAAGWKERLAGAG